MSVQSSILSPNSMPQDKVRLDVLLITGQRKFFLFDPSTTVKSAREAIWDEWPQDWPTRPIHRSSVRILHLGHILDDKAVLCGGGASGGSGTEKSPATVGGDGLSSGNMSAGHSYVVHLLIRQEPSKSNKDDESPDGALKKSSTEMEEGAEGGGCCCVIC